MYPTHLMARHQRDTTRAWCLRSGQTRAFLGIIGLENRICVRGGAPYYLNCRSLNVRVFAIGVRQYTLALRAPLGGGVSQPSWCRGRTPVAFPADQPATAGVFRRAGNTDRTQPLGSGALEGTNRVLCELIPRRETDGSAPCDVRNCRTSHAARTTALCSRGLRSTRSGA